MVSAVRKNESISSVAARFGVARATVRFWVERAGDQRLDRVNFSDRAAGPRTSGNRVSRNIEDRVLAIRRELREESPLGECGAEAIARELKKRRIRPQPSVRTIGRILLRRGALDGRRRIRRPAPPPGWYLPDLAAGRAELDSFDIVEGLALQGGRRVEVLNGISLHGGLAVSWTYATIYAKTVVSALTAHWRQFGFPDYAQFDNDTVFQGPHAHCDVVGRVTRLCLSMGVTPVFAPPRETGFQAAIESFNGRWQAAVWNLNLQELTEGRIVYLRRTDDSGRASLLGHTFDVDHLWPHRLVRAEIDLAKDRIRFHALRRRTPEDQPLLNEITHHIPRNKFNE